MIASTVTAAMGIFARGIGDEHLSWFHNLQTISVAEPTVSGISLWLLEGERAAASTT